MDSLNSIPQGQFEAQMALLMNFTNHLRNKSNFIQSLPWKSFPTHFIREAKPNTKLDIYITKGIIT